jgi:type III secretion protein J
MVYNSFFDNKVSILYRITVAISLLILISGCTDQVLYSSLSERDANEIVALLYNKGIPVTKKANNDNTYSISTMKKSFSQAIELLRKNGLPKNHFESLGEVFKKEGFVSSPLEERARLNYAQSQELARTIESIDGVLLARVHLAIPEDNDMLEKNKPSSASVFLKHRRGLDLSDRESQIKALIVNSIEGLPYKNVTVAMFSADPIPVFTKKSEDPDKFNITTTYQEYLLIILIVLVIIFSGTTILLWLRMRKTQPEYKMTKTS